MLVTKENVDRNMFLFTVKERDRALYYIRRAPVRGPIDQPICDSAFIIVYTLDRLSSIGWLKQICLELSATQYLLVSFIVIDKTDIIITIHSAFKDLND